MAAPTSLANVRQIEFQTVSDPRGDLSVLEAGKNVPFEIRRVFYIYNVPSEAQRGGHALRECEQLLIAIAGSLDVVAHDGTKRVQYHLSNPAQGLYLPPMIWRELVNFSPGAVCLALASKTFSEPEYYRDFDAYLAAVISQK